MVKPITDSMEVAITDAVAILEKAGWKVDRIGRGCADECSRSIHFRSAGEGSENSDGAVRWIGDNMIEMCSFVRSDISATTPNGPMGFKTPDGEIIVQLGQWVIKKNGKFSVADKQP
jgi:hypothetical protein